MLDAKITPYGSHAVSISWENEISQKVHHKVILFEAYLKENFSASIFEIKSTYQAIVVFLNREIRPQDFMRDLSRIEIDFSKKKHIKKTIWKIPVHYASNQSKDIAFVAKHNSLTIEEVIKIHAQKIYPIYFIGFLPGFLYLGGLDKRLHTPRKLTPDLTIPKGTVAIGGAQTGIYPTNSPGGWQSIGITPIELFDVNQNPPSIFNPGDYIQFFPINSQEFQVIQRQITIGHYSISKEITND